MGVRDAISHEPITSTVFGFGSNRRRALKRLSIDDKKQPLAPFRRQHLISSRSLSYEVRLLALHR